MRPWAKNPFKRQLGKGYCLRPESARQILHAERFAYALKRNLNVSLTIVFNARPKAIGLTYYDIFRTKIWANLRRRWNAAMARKGSQKPFAAICVFDNPPNKTYGKRHYGPLHAHLLLEWPESDWQRMLYFVRRMMAKYFVNFRPSQVTMHPVNYSLGFASYLAKGIDPPYAEHFYLTHVPQGPITHRRIIISRSLGLSARKRFRRAGGNPLPNRRKRFATRQLSGSNRPFGQ